MNNSLEKLINETLKKSIVDSSPVALSSVIFEESSRNNVGVLTETKVPLKISASQDFWGKVFDKSFISLGFSVAGSLEYHAIYGVLIAPNKVLIHGHSNSTYTPAENDLIYFRARTPQGKTGGLYSVLVDSVKTARQDNSSGDYIIVSLKTNASQSTVVTFLNDSSDSRHLNLSLTYPFFSFSPDLNKVPHGYIHSATFSGTEIILRPNPLYGVFPVYFEQGMSGGPIYTYIHSASERKFIPIFFGFNLYSGNGKGFDFNSKAIFDESQNLKQLMVATLGEFVEPNMIFIQETSIDELLEKGIKDYEIDTGYNYNRDRVLSYTDEEIETSLPISPTDQIQITYNVLNTPFYAANYKLISAKKDISNDLEISLKIQYNKITKTLAKKICSFLDSKKGFLKFEFTMPESSGYGKFLVFCKKYSISKTYKDSVDISVDLFCDSFNNSLNWKKSGDNIINIPEFQDGASYKKGDIVRYEAVQSRFYKSKHHLFFVCKKDVNFANEFYAPDVGEFWTRKFIHSPSYPLEVSGEFKTVASSDSGWSKRYSADSNALTLTSQNFSFTNLPNHQAANIVKFFLARNFERFKMELPEPYKSKKVFLPISLTHNILNKRISSIELQCAEDSLGATDLGVYEDSIPSTKLEGFTAYFGGVFEQSQQNPQLPNMEIDVNSSPYAYNYQTIPIAPNIPYAEVDAKIVSALKYFGQVPTLPS